MLFSSWQFIFAFLPVALGVFFAIPQEFRTLRKWWLLAASLFFYGYWKVEYVPLLLFSIGFNYAAAEGITRWRGRAGSRAVLVFGVGVNLLLLGYYKYTNFVLEAFGRASGQTPARFDIILPLAISFFTFTQIGYLVDVYRDQRLHYRLLDYAVFVVFFPHLIAGPIVRHWEIIPQFAEKDLRVNRADMGVGVAIFLLGLYKKMLLADPASHYADTIFGAAESGRMLTCFDGWLGTTAYAFQIYFDFSGYSDMAIGLARMFGMRFPRNFDSPYKAGSIITFWRSWHITLTRFLGEYVYFPMGGNRCSKARHLGNIMVLMLVSGLWHGAGWTFLVWGGLHGIYLVIANVWRDLKKARGWQFTHWSYRGACVLLTFVAVLFAWAFFRAKTLPAAGRVVASMAGVNGPTIPYSGTEGGELAVASADEAMEPQKAPPGGKVGRVLQTLGVRFVAQQMGDDFYKPGVRLMLLLLLIAWALPNTQQLLRDHDPTLEPVERGSRWQLPLNGYTGLALGVLFFGVICSYFVAKPSPFIYFNF
jgi:D-alanyl-lipoteichoic acid acyltransferase DltB (MBOAT superfamily)